MNKEIYYNLLNKGLYALTYESNQNKKAVLLEIKSFCSQIDYEYATNVGTSTKDATPNGKSSSWIRKERIRRF